MPRKRFWCAHCQYEGKEKFILGTAEAESELGAEKELIKIMDDILPIRPKLLAIVPGMLVFHEDKHA